MRLIDIDAFRKVNGMADNCVGCERDAKECNYDRIYTLMDFCTLLDCAPIVNQWIPCSERLPKQGQEVICQCRASIIKILKLNANGDWYQDARHCYMRGFVIAWMPLPELWKGENHETD